MLRAMRTLFVCALLAVTAARAAADCDPKVTKQLYVKAERPIKVAANAPAPPSLTILTSGAWTRTGDAAGTGCLTDARKKLVTDAVAAAQFKTNTKAKRCRVAAMKHVVYAAPDRKLHVEHDEPCGVPFDPATSAMIACADAVVDSKVADDDAAKICKP